MIEKITKNKLKIAAWIVVLIMTMGSGTHLLRSTIKYDQTRAIIMAVIVFFVCVAFKLGNPKKKATSFAAPKNMRRYIPLSIIPILLLAIWAANRRIFGQFDVSAVFFHLTHDLTYKGLSEDVVRFSWYIFFGFVLIACISYLARRDRRMALIEKIFAVVILTLNPVTTYTFDRFIHPDRNTLNLIDAYHPVEISQFPAKKKNLLIVYLESLEATFEKDEFGDVFEDLDEMAEEGLRINGIKQVQDTGWTTAGMAASQCGVPLLSYGLIMRNRMKEVDSFLPNAKCLASELSENGYQTRYLGGADLNFAGKDAFLSTHGYQKTTGLLEIPEDQRGDVNKWGIYDDRLFDLAFEELRTLSAADEPFLLSVLTIGPHSPAGYPAKVCYDLIENADALDTTLLAVACTAKMARNFINEAKAEGLLEDTVVVVLSDHLSHKNTQTPNLSKYDRENFILFLVEDQAPGTLTKPGTMFDLYPTILESMGFSPTENAAGLGTSLLGQAPTLMEQYGEKVIDLSIRSDKELREELWNLNPLETSTARP